MKIIDLPDPKRIEKPPTQSKIIFSSGTFVQNGVTIKKIELRLYIEHHDSQLGDYSLITCYVETDIGTIEMLYDEGFRGEDSLNRAATFLMSNLGLSGLLLRSIIALKEESEST